MADLLGLAIGFALGGAALAHYLPRLQALHGGQAVALQRAPPSPAPLPRVIVPTPHVRPPPGPPLPNVVHPAPPVRITSVAGTGFFIARDGSLLTAAHVASDCRRIQVVSRFLPLSGARLVAADTQDDAALLRADRVRPPAILPLGRPAGRAGRLFILGYPASAGPVVPAETWGTLENARLPAGSGRFADPGFLVWLEAGAVTHGYSGGPMLDPRNGAVVGLVKGTVEAQHLRQLSGMPANGVAIGPGATRLIGFLREEAPWLDVTQADAEGDDAVALARRATVHVLCWR